MRIGLPSGPSASSPNAVGVLASELEDVADLDAARDRQPAAAARAQVAVADLDRADLAVGLEVAAAHDGRGVPAVGSFAPVTHALPGTTSGSTR